MLDDEYSSNWKGIETTFLAGHYLNCLLEGSLSWNSSFMRKIYYSTIFDSLRNWYSYVSLVKTASDDVGREPMFYNRKLTYRLWHCN